MVSVSTLAAITVDGLAFGASLALLGVGITLVYGLGEVLNLAIGAFAVIAAISASLLTSEGVALPIAAVAGLGLVGVFGLVIDRTLLSLVYRSDGEERILLGIFTTLGLAVLLEGVLVNFVSSRYSLPLDISPIDVGTTVVTGTSVVSIVVATVVLAVLFAFLNRTFLGKATREIEFDTLFANPIQYADSGELENQIQLYSTLSLDAPSYYSEGNYSYEEVFRTDPLPAIAAAD